MRGLRGGLRECAGGMSTVYHDGRETRSRTTGYPDCGRAGPASPGRRARRPRALHAKFVAAAASQARACCRHESSSRAAQLMLCADRLKPDAYEQATAGARMHSPDEAVATGFLHRVLPASELLQAAIAEADRLASDSFREQKHVSTKAASTYRICCRRT